MQRDRPALFAQTSYHYKLSTTYNKTVAAFGGLILIRTNVDVGSGETRVVREVAGGWGQAGVLGVLVVALVDGLRIR